MQVPLHRFGARTLSVHLCSETKFETITRGSKEFLAFGSVRFYWRRALLRGCQLVVVQAGQSATRYSRYLIPIRSNLQWIIPPTTAQLLSKSARVAARVTVISSESPPPPKKMAEMGIKTLSYPVYFCFVFNPPPTCELTPEGSFFAKKMPAPGGNTEKSAIFLPSIVNYLLFKEKSELT